MSDTLLNGLHPELWYDLTATTDNNLGYIFYQNRVFLKALLFSRKNIFT